MELMSLTEKGEEIYNQPLAREVTEAFVAWSKEIGIAWGFAGKVSQLSQNVQN